MIWQGSAGVFEAPPGTPLASACFRPSFLTTEGKPPRGSRGPGKGDRRLVFQDGLDDLPVFDEADDAHGSPALRAGQGIDFIDLLDQPGPVLPVFLGALIGFQDAGYCVALFFIPFSPGDITVIPIIPDHLFPPVFPGARFRSVWLLRSDYKSRASPLSMITSPASPFSPNGFWK
jgi:hypothetical protein